MNPIATIIADHHDYVWARLPFIVPMAVAVARRTGDRMARELAQMTVELRPLLLGHLEREERLLVAPSVAESDRLRAEHLAVTSLLQLIRGATGLAEHGFADPTARALHSELAALDEHLAAQIALEDELMMIATSSARRDQRG